jgi:hypothetical protein
MNKMFAIREQKFAHDNPLAIMGEGGDPPTPPSSFFPKGATPPPIFFVKGDHPPPLVCVKVGVPPLRFQRHNPAFRVESSTERACRKRPEGGWGWGGTPSPTLA